jgi:uncharacterized membrane protein
MPLEVGEVFYPTLAQLVVDGPFVLNLVSRVAHILSAVILVGGLFYIRSILSPAGVEACFAGRWAIWAKWVGIATFLLLASGIYNFLVIHNGVEAAGGKLPSTYHMLFGIKFLLALAVMFFAAVLAGKTELAERFRRNMRRWLNLAWMSALAVIVIGAILRTLH